jgi:RNA polymerase sigma factor (sigma-70 family)
LTEPDNAPDHELTRRARAGDQRAFAILITRHKHWLYRFVRRYVGSAEDAQDVLQESFVAALTNLARYDPERPFDVWLRRIALNKCRDRARRRAVRRAVGLEQPADRDPADIIDPSAPADAKLGTDRALRALDQAIAQLPAALKEPLVLTALEGLSQKEAGELLGLSAKAVEVRVYRAKRQLALQLDRASVSDLLDTASS